MAGPRDRSRYRGIESQYQYELQDLLSSQLNPTGEDSTAHSKDSYDDRIHGHPQKSGAPLLDRRFSRTCKQRLDGILGTGRARSATFLRMCSKSLSKHRMMTLCIAFIFSVLLLLAFRGLDPRAEPSDYGLDRSTGQAVGPPFTTAMTSHFTVYRTISVQYNQFHGARPVHHQAPMAVPSNLEFTGQAKGQELLKPLIMTGTPTSVSGLYFVPMAVTDGGWRQTQQDTQPSSRPATNAQVPQDLQGSQNLAKSKLPAELLLQSREIRAARNLFSNQADADTTSFTRWGVELLYDLRCRSRRNLHFSKASCIENACRPYEQLNSMCNTTKAIHDSFRKKECEWCWPENQRKHLEIEKHCTKVSKRAFNAVFTICGILLSFTLVIAIVMATRLLRRRRRAKADRNIHQTPTNFSPHQEKINGVRGHQLLHKNSNYGRSSKAGTTRVDKEAIRDRSPGEDFSSIPWYKSVSAKCEKRLGISPTNPASGRSKPHKQRTESLGQEITNRLGDVHVKAPDLPPVPPAIGSRVFSEIENMGRGCQLLSSGTNGQNNIEGMLRPSSRQSRTVSSGSEQNLAEAAHPRDAGSPNVYAIH